jgi:hypothetical protein
MREKEGRPQIEREEPTKRKKMMAHRKRRKMGVQRRVGRLR